jgi:hypothetical protein
MDRVRSVNGVSIRLSGERWRHIVENHNDLAGYYHEVLRTVEKPDLVISGYGGALIALKGVARRRYLAVVYKELSPTDGFILSAYFTRRPDRRRQVWPR